MAGLRPPALIPSNTQTFSEGPQLLHGAANFLTGRGQAKQEVELAEAQMQAAADRQFAQFAAGAVQQVGQNAVTGIRQKYLADQAEQAYYDRGNFERTGMEPGEIDAGYAQAQQGGFSGSRADYVQQQEFKRAAAGAQNEWAITQGYTPQQMQQYQQLEAARVALPQDRVLNSPMFGGGATRMAELQIQAQQAQIRNNPALIPKAMKPTIAQRVSGGEVYEHSSGYLIHEGRGGILQFESPINQAAPQIPQTAAEIEAYKATRVIPLPEMNGMILVDSKGNPKFQKAETGGASASFDEDFWAKTYTGFVGKNSPKLNAEGEAIPYTPAEAAEMADQVYRAREDARMRFTGQSQAGGGGAAPSAADDVDVYRQSLKDRRIPERFHEPLTEIARQTANGEINPELLQVAEAASTARTPAQKEGVKAFIVQRFPMGDPNLSPEDRQVIAKAFRMLSEGGSNGG